MLTRLTLLIALLALTALGCESKANLDSPKAEGAQAKASTPDSPKAKAQPAATTPDNAPEAAAKAPAAKAPGAAAHATNHAAEAAKSDHAGCADPDAPVEAKKNVGDAPRHFGAPFTLDTTPLTVAEALAQGDTLADKNIRLTGHVQSVCKKKGCWMQLKPASAEAAPVRVTFKDYGFFVPLDADGTDAVLEGTLILSTTTEAMRRHYAQDAGKSPEEIAAIKGDTRAFKFVATAVELSRAPTP